MELTRRSSLVVCGLFLAGQGGGVLTAQRPAPWPDGRIGGFISVPWGATAKDIEAVLGSSLMSRAAGDSGQVLIFRHQVAGRSVLALLYLDHDRGLVKGVYSAPYGMGSECEVVFEKFKALVRQLYPSLKPVERRTHRDQSLPFCSAANLDKASWSVEWTDPGGNSARVVLEPGEARVATTFASRGLGPAPRP